jgi:hypothetical protein
MQKLAMGTLPLITFLSLFFTPYVVNGQTCPDSKKLPITLERQLSDSWCWATAANIAMRYLGGTQEQCFVVDAVRQNQLEIYSPNTCCIANTATTPGCGDIWDYSWAALDEFNFTYDMVGESTFGWPQLREEICRDGPIVYGEDYKDGGGHQYVIYGFVEDQTIGEKNIVIYSPIDKPSDYREEPYETWLRMQSSSDELRSNVEFLINIAK